MSAIHRIGHQTIDVQVDSEDDAIALQSRLSDFNRRRLLPIIERVFDELDKPGLHVLIGNLEIDLGHLPATGFEDEAQKRLYRELRRVLGDNLRRLDKKSGVHSRTESDRNLELLEYYLQYGSLPFWAGSTSFDATNMFAALAESDPKRLASLVRRLGRNPNVVRRLAIQLSVAHFRRLIHVLEPAHAALIIGYMIDLQMLHDIEPFIELSNERYAKHLRILVLTYLIRERGSQFNRKSFVKSLLTGMAESEGLDYADIVRSLVLGIEYAQRRHPLDLSFPSVVIELAHEVDRELEAKARIRDSSNQTDLETSPASNDSVPSASETLARFEHYIRTGFDSSEVDKTNTHHQQYLAEIFDQLDARERKSARRLIWRLASSSNPGKGVIVQRLLQSFSLREILAFLAPQRFAFVTDFIAALNRANQSLASGRHHELNTIGIAAHESAVSYFLNEASSRSQVRDVIRYFLDNQPSYSDELIKTTIDICNQKTSGTNALIARELKSIRRQTDGKPGQHVSLDSTHRGPVFDGRKVAAPVISRYDQAAIVRYFIRFGILPWTAVALDPNLTIQHVSVYLTKLPRALVADTLSIPRSSKPLPGLMQILRALSEVDLMELIRCLTPTHRTNTPFQTSLESFAAQSGNRHRFFANVVSAFVHHQPLDFEELALPTSVNIAKTTFPKKLEEWDGKLLISALMTHFALGQKSKTVLPSPSNLMSHLLSNYANETRAFLNTIRKHSKIRSEISQLCEGSLFPSFLEIIRPNDTHTILELNVSLGRIPVQYRPRSDAAIQHGLATILLDHRFDAPLSERFFRTVLQELFGPQVPQRVYDLLNQSQSNWNTNPRIPKECTQAFQAALKPTSHSDSMSTDGKGFGHDQPTPAVKPTQTEIESVAPGENKAVDPKRRAFDKSIAKSLVAPDSRKDSVGAKNGKRSNQNEYFTDIELLELTRLLDESPQQVLTVVEPKLRDSRNRRYWVEQLSEPVLSRLVFVLEPRAFRKLMDTAELLASTWRQAVPIAFHSKFSRKHFWTFVFEFLSRTTPAERTQKAMVSAFFERMSTQLPASAPPEIGEQLVDTLSVLAQTSGHSTLRAMMSGERQELLAVWSTKKTQPIKQKKQESRPPKAVAATNANDSIENSRKQSPVSHRPKTSSQTEFQLNSSATEDIGDDPIYLANAGLVLAGAFLPMLFQKLEMLTKSTDDRTRFHDTDTASRAVHLLQSLVDSRTDAPEPELVLNKILCGVPLGAAIDREITPTQNETEACETLLNSMLSNWTSIKNTSVEGLQETFMRRDGRLRKFPDHWELKVQRKTLDILVDQIPWSLSVIFHRWMSIPIHVNW